MDSWETALQRIDHLIWSIQPQLGGAWNAIEELNTLAQELGNYYPPEYEEQETAERILSTVAGEVSKIGMDADRLAESIRSICVSVRAEMR